MSKGKHTILADMKAYEILEIKKAGDEITLKLSGPLAGDIRETVAVNGSDKTGDNVVQLINNIIVDMLPLKSVIFTTETL